MGSRTFHVFYGAFVHNIREIVETAENMDDFEFDEWSDLEKYGFVSIYSTSGAGSDYLGEELASFSDNEGREHAVNIHPDEGAIDRFIKMRDVAIEKFGAELGDAGIWAVAGSD